jgi:hypothetical protein
LGRSVWRVDRFSCRNIGKFSFCILKISATIIFQGKVLGQGWQMSDSFLEVVHNVPHYED